MGYEASGVNEKQCTKCKTVRPLDDFHRLKNSSDGRRSQCKLCRIPESKSYREANPEKIKKYKHLWHKANYLRTKESVRVWQQENPEKVKVYKARWAKANPEKVHLYQKRMRVKKLSTPQGKLHNNVSCLLWYYLRGNKNWRHWEDLVGYTVDQLKCHLEKKFLVGMSWENYGKVWEIDHKIPVSAFNFETPDDLDFRRCWALKNLQPLWKTDNREKSGRVERPFQPSLMIVEGL